jgi:hypothetical protein
MFYAANYCNRFLDHATHGRAAPAFTAKTMHQYAPNAELAKDLQSLRSRLALQTPRSLDSGRLTPMPPGLRSRPDRLPHR